VHLQAFAPSSQKTFCASKKNLLPPGGCPHPTVPEHKCPLEHHCDAHKKHSSFTGKSLASGNLLRAPSRLRVLVAKNFFFSLLEPLPSRLCDKKNFWPAKENLFPVNVPQNTIPPHRLPKNFYFHISLTFDCKQTKKKKTSVKPQTGTFFF